MKKLGRAPIPPRGLAAIKMFKCNDQKRIRYRGFSKKLYTKEEEKNQVKNHYTASRFRSDSENEKKKKKNSEL